MLEHLHPCGMSMPAQVCYLYRMFAFGQTLSCNGKVNKHKAGICTPSLLKIPVNHFVLDELHLLQIFLCTFDNLMALVTMLDNAARDGSHKYVEGLATAVRECGVTFHIWKDKEGGDKCKYTSLTGNGMKKV